MTSDPIRENQPGPVFIGGPAGSGKTLLRLMLNAHPEFAITRQTYTWTRFYGRYGNLARPSNFERCLCAMLATRSVQALQPDVEYIRRAFWQGPPTYARLFELVLEQAASRAGKPRWGEQLRWIERYTQPIFSAYPAARMIHMIRDPRDRYEASESALRHRRGKIGWASALWLASARLARENQQRYPNRYIVLQYETLISQPEQTLRQLCSSIGATFTPAMLDVAGALSVTPPSPHHQPGQMARQLLSPGELVFTQTVTRMMMQSFGYHPESVMLTRRDWLRCACIDWPVNLAGMLAWHILAARLPA